MKLPELIAQAAPREPLLGWTLSDDPGDVDVGDLCLDSRRARPGSLFFCLIGENSDGHAFADEAVRNGATALVVERWLDIDVAQVLVASVRRAMAWVSLSFWADPGSELSVIGITGTNGKTTTAHLVKSIMDSAGRPCGLLGTLTGERTTPESTDLQESLRAMVDEGLTAVAMEVSSHALVQERVLGMTFDVAVFTNLSPEHLDYHGSLADYFEAKASLFRPGVARAAVVNESDEHGRRLLAEVDLETAAYSRDQLIDPKLHIDGTKFTWRGQRIDLALPGLFNLENAVAAAEAARLLGVDDSQIAAGLSAASQVPGRFEVVVDDPSAGPTVIVDYSHTPAGLEQVLLSVREIVPEATLCVVFGAAGDRDAEKRPLMGAAAEANADYLVITSDNPRSEDPNAILADVLAGVVNTETVTLEPDRRTAIKIAIMGHDAGDVVVVAGKGHETTQTVGQSVLDFDDRVVVREVMTERAAQ